MHFICPLHFQVPLYEVSPIQRVLREISRMLMTRGERGNLLGSEGPLYGCVQDFSSCDCSPFSLCDGVCLFVCLSVCLSVPSLCDCVCQIFIATKARYQGPLPRPATKARYPMLLSVNIFE